MRVPSFSTAKDASVRAKMRRGAAVADDESLPCSEIPYLYTKTIQTREIFPLPQPTSRTKKRPFSRELHCDVYPERATRFHYTQL